MKKPPPLIALITDFGASDWYAGSVKGKIRSFCPEARIDDITHEIPPGDVRAASYVLASCIECFPPETVFLVIVDPGVGTDRKAIMGRMGNGTLVCPNNGIISNVYRKFSSDRGPFYEILPEHSSADSISSTFHGRDLFAPIVGKIAAGKMKLQDLGDVVSDIVLLDLPQPEIKKGFISGEINYIDHFGNAVTNISRTELNLFTIKSSAFVRVNDARISLKTTFGDVDAGKPLTYIGSNGFLEIGMNKDNASEKMKLKVGDIVKFYTEASVSSDLPVIKAKSNQPE